MRPRTALKQQALAEAVGATVEKKHQRGVWMLTWWAHSIRRSGSTGWRVILQQTYMSKITACSFWQLQWNRKISWSKCSMPWWCFQTVLRLYIQITDWKADLKLALIAASAWIGNILCVWWWPISFIHLWYDATCVYWIICRYFFILPS